MPVSKEEKGERDTYTARYRGNIGHCTGWDTSRDPSTLPDTSLVSIINARVEDGIVVSRGGQSKVSAQADSECVYGMIEVSGGVSLFLSPIDLGGAGNFDTFVEGKAVEYVRLSTSDDNTGIPSSDFAELNTRNQTLPRFCFAQLGSRIIMSAEANIIYEVMVPEGEVDLSKIRLRPLVTIPTGKIPSSMHSIPGFPDTLYIGTVSGNIYQFDGTTLTDITPVTPATDRVILTSLLGVLIAANSQDIRRYVNGAWTAAITLPAGVPATGVTTFRPMCAIEFNGNAYIGGEDIVSGLAAIIIISSAGVATMGTTVEQATSYRVVDFASWQGSLYYLWEGEESVTPYLLLVEYGDLAFGNAVALDTEPLEPRGGRLYVAGGRLFIGYVGDEPGVLTGPALSEWNGTTLVLLADRTDIDDYGAIDIIAF